MIENVEQVGATGVLAALCFAMLDFLKSQFKENKAKKNGGTTYTRLSLIEESTRDLETGIRDNQEKLQSFHRDFCEFREEVRVNMAVQKAKAETLRELKNE